MTNKTVTIIERLILQASRIEALATLVAGFLGPQAKLAQDLFREHVVLNSIIDQVKDEETAKVETFTNPEKSDQANTDQASAEPEMPPEVKAVMDSIMDALKAQGVDASVEVIAIPRGDRFPRTPLNIEDILKNL